MTRTQITIAKEQAHKAAYQAGQADYAKAWADHQSRTIGTRTTPPSHYTPIEISAWYEGWNQAADYFLDLCLEITIG